MLDFYTSPVITEHQTHVGIDTFKQRIDQDPEVHTDPITVTMPMNRRYQALRDPMPSSTFSSLPGMKWSDNTKNSSSISTGLIDCIRQTVIGEGNIFDGRFGLRRITYADYAASGRSTSFIEDVVRHEVVPFHANTHTEVSQTGRQTSRLRENARDIIQQAVGAGVEDVVIFGGSGSTFAVNRMVDILDLKKEMTYRTPGLWSLSAHMGIIPIFSHGAKRAQMSLSSKRAARDISIKSNLQLNFFDIKIALSKLAVFSAGSNVTGILTDVDTISSLLHQHSALALWDYAAAAPHVSINMNPDGEQGPRNKGLSLSRLTSLLAVQRYETSPVHREEGATPDIIEPLPAGLEFRIKQEIGAGYIERQ
ncbi:aminotransferase [Phaffia rhodozyma]|uniref:Aminotransferase n=1 Tax=Phaffia rhodozyma TaxID=264483 RepID=A0A0F7SGE0_PHARH|nr:aminotransferase [Phaffia rhodozyma]